MSESMKQTNDRLVQDNVDLKCEAEGKDARIAELEAENERLKVCGNCGNEAPNKNHAMCVGIVRLCNRWAKRSAP